jgi:hypothetical protein
MDVGTAILLSSFCFAVIYLYKITRNTWDWSKAGRRTLKGFAFLILIGIIFGIGFAIHAKIKNLPSKQTEYADLRLGMTMAEVKYIKGQPAFVLADHDPNDKFPDQRVLEAQGLRVDDFRSWQYDISKNGQARLDVDFDKSGTVNKIGCYSNGLMTCPVLLGLYDRSTEDSMINRLGKPTEEHIDKSSGVKKVQYKDFNAWFYLNQKTIYMMGIITNPSPQ